MPNVSSTLGLRSMPSFLWLARHAREGVTWNLQPGAAAYEQWLSKEKAIGGAAADFRATQWLRSPGLRRLASLTELLDWWYAAAVVAAVEPTWTARLDDLLTPDAIRDVDLALAELRERFPAEHRLLLTACRAAQLPELLYADLPGRVQRAYLEVALAPVRPSSFGRHFLEILRHLVEDYDDRTELGTVSRWLKESKSMCSLGLPWRTRIGDERRSEKSAWLLDESARSSAGASKLFDGWTDAVLLFPAKPRDVTSRQVEVRKLDLALRELQARFPEAYQELTDACSQVGLLPVLYERPETPGYNRQAEARRVVMQRDAARRSRPPASSLRHRRGHPPTGRAGGRRPDGGHGR